MIPEKGEKVHVIMRRLFEGDIHRHFIGTVISDAVDGAVRLQDYVFVWNRTFNKFERRPEERTRVVSLNDAINIINIIPSSVLIEDVHYASSESGHLIITDGADFKMDVDEFRFSSRV
ncbi:MAG: hypothetical protein QMD53_05420 [Actinomycetota bacterium]|nr:hypothetical protein [Actinomycetota bacterium]